MYNTPGSNIQGITRVTRANNIGLYIILYARVCYILTILLF